MYQGVIKWSTVSSKHNYRSRLPTKSIALAVAAPAKVVDSAITADVATHPMAVVSDNREVIAVVPAKPAGSAVTVDEASPGVK